MKKTISILLALVFCLAMALPAAACTGLLTGGKGGNDLSKGRQGKDTIVIAQGENENANWHGVKIGDTKAEANEKLKPEFPLMYELSAIGNMNLYADKTVTDHYLTIYFDENDRVTQIIWQVDQIMTID